MNHYDSYITEYLITNKEVALGKIGVIKLSGSYSDNESLAAAVDFRCDKRISTSQELIDFIAAIAMMVVQVQWSQLVQYSKNSPLRPPRGYCNRLLVC